VKVAFGEELSVWGTEVDDGGGEIEDRRVVPAGGPAADWVTVDALPAMSRINAALCSTREPGAGAVCATGWAAAPTREPATCAVNRGAGSATKAGVTASGRVAAAMDNANATTTSVLARGNPMPMTRGGSFAGRLREP
jgi:hypothetical protein